MRPGCFSASDRYPFGMFFGALGSRTFRHISSCHILQTYRKTPCMDSCLFHKVHIRVAPHVTSGSTQALTFTP